MTTEQAIRKIMEIRGIKFSELADELCIANNTLAGRLKSKNISIEKLVEILDVLGYKVVVVPEEADIKRWEFEIR